MFLTLHILYNPNGLKLRQASQIKKLVFQFDSSLVIIPQKAQPNQCEKHAVIPSPTLPKIRLLDGFDQFYVNL